VPLHLSKIPDPKFMSECHNLVPSSSRSLAMHGYGSAARTHHRPVLYDPAKVEPTFRVDLMTGDRHPTHITQLLYRLKRERWV
jgi:hypothetical protein